MVEQGCLLSSCAGNGTGGSNPTLSARLVSALESGSYARCYKAAAKLQHWFACKVVLAGIVCQAMATKAYTLISCAEGSFSHCATKFMLPLASGAYGQGRELFLTFNVK